jgi:hypothetical protein
MVRKRKKRGKASVLTAQLNESQVLSSLINDLMSLHYGSKGPGPVPERDGRKCFSERGSADVVEAGVLVVSGERSLVRRPSADYAHGIRP